MRALTFALALLAAGLTAGLAGCTTDPNDPAIRAMTPVNACGSGGTSDINACPPTGAIR